MREEGFLTIRPNFLELVNRIDLELLRRWVCSGR